MRALKRAAALQYKQVMRAPTAINQLHFVIRYSYRVLAAKSFGHPHFINVDHVPNLCHAALDQLPRHSINMAAELPAWPPSMTPEQEEALLQHSVDWALSHSLVLRPVPRAADTSSAPSSSPFNTSVMHAPFALLPTPFPRAAFKKAVSLQCAYNDLYANIASSPDFLHQILAPVAAVDPFQAQLYEIYKSTMRTDAAHKPQQQTTLGLFRSDYLLHQEDGLPKQVEFNTVSSSFGALSTRVSEMHREASKAGHALFPQHAALKLDNLPENQALDALADGLAAGHKAFNKTSRCASAWPLAC